MNGLLGFRESPAWPWVRVALWCGVIFLASGRPDLGGRLDLQSAKGIAEFVFRKIAHLSEYAVLMILFLAAAERTWRFRKGLLLAGFLFVTLYAATDEWHQSFVPGRNGTVMDVFVDSVGGLAGFFLRRIFLKT